MHTYIDGYFDCGTATEIKRRRGKRKTHQNPSLPNTCRPISFRFKYNKSFMFERALFAAPSAALPPHREQYRNRLPLSVYLPSSSIRRKFSILYFFMMHTFTRRVL